MAKRRDQEDQRKLLKSLKVRKDPEDPDFFRISVTSDEIEVVLRHRHGQLVIEEMAVPVTVEEEQPQPEPLAEIKIPRLTLSQSQRLKRRTNFADNIRRWIRHENLSQREASERLKIDVRLLQRWIQKGIAQPSKRTREELSRLQTELALIDLWNEKWSPYWDHKRFLDYLEASGQIETAMESLSAILSEKGDESSGDPRVDLESVIENTFKGNVTDDIIRLCCERLGVCSP